MGHIMVFQRPPKLPYIEDLLLSEDVVAAIVDSTVIDLGGLTDEIGSRRSEVISRH